MEKNQIKKNDNVIGPIDRRTWLVLRTYYSALKYHKEINNTKVIEMVRPIYREAMKSIRKVS